MALTASPTTAMQQAPQSSVMNYTRTTSNPQDINTIVGGMVDRCPWRWWDTFTWTLASPAVAVPSQINFFQVAMNQVDPYTAVPKTKVDTNMTQPGQFTPPYCLVMDQIGFHIVSTDTKADLDKFWNQCWMEFKILGKIFFEGLLWMFPGAFGFSGTQNPSSTDQSWVNGLPAPQYGWRLGKYSRYIPPLTNFSLRLYFPGTPPTLASSFKVVAYLDGLTDNPVQ